MIATLGWMLVVWLAIVLICSIATGKAAWGELRPWLVVWLVVTLFCAGFHVLVLRRTRWR